jgi:hypothetical protein
MRTIDLAGVLAVAGAPAPAAALDLGDFLQGDRLIDVVFVAVLVLVGLFAAGVAYKRSVDD